MAIQLSQERRRAPRIAVLVRVECSTPQNYTVGTCQNISETGMLVKTRQLLDVSQAVTLRFALTPASTGKVIQTSGIVVRVDAGEYMAVQFTELRPTVRNTIARYVEQNMRE